MSRKKRVGLSKKARFEVFKRDQFTCQYCGAHPPAAILHVDHIQPVAEGGGNEPDNLITACAACNGGKGARLLSATPESLANRSIELMEREDQLRGYQAFLRDRAARLDDECWEVAETLEPGATSEGFDRADLLSVRRFIERLGLFAVKDAAELAFVRLPSASTNRRFRYFCGICWKLIKEHDDASA